MRSSKANIAGLASLLQQAEMKSILAGAWPPLKPLPVFKYETAEYRATIDFDKKRGEWVCRKTSLPSNSVQELRGGLREITMALPHSGGEIFIEEGEPQEHELEKDAHRRLQAMQEWRKNHQNGALYFELRHYLSESQQSEIDDSLRLSLTARQLQCNPKNAAYVFDALASAGGRFAALVEFAKRMKAKQGAEHQAGVEELVVEAEPGMGHEEQSPGVSTRKLEPVLNTQPVRDLTAAESCPGGDELPAVSIKNVLPEPEQASIAEQTAPHNVLEQLASEFLGGDSASLVEHPDREERNSPAFSGLATHMQASHAPADHGESSSSHFPALEISAFQLTVFAALFLSATFAFTVGLTVGRGPLASRLREAPKSMFATDGKLGAVAESTAQTSTPAATSAKESGISGSPGETLPPEKKSTEESRGSEYSAKARFADSASSPAPESTLSSTHEVSLEHGGTMEPGIAAPRALPPVGVAPYSPRATTILVTRPGRGGQPFRVSFPEKSIAATPSLAMSSQLSVVVSSEPGFAAAHKSARLEAGDLTSFVWPRYSRPGNRQGLAETIKVRATIGQSGQVQEVKLLGGSSSLLPATKAAIRHWRYRPTLLDKRPIQAQQDVTIEFRPRR
ncbi:MAG TPA: energy transducer TonB [Candidatus Acidoferrum sp.]|nr:energy transducer TonB [Candidatus Acidoferrum sp.]